MSRIRRSLDQVAGRFMDKALDAEVALATAGRLTGKSHSLVAFGVAAVEAGHKVRYFTAADLVEALYRGLPLTRHGLGAS